MDRNTPEEQKTEFPRGSGVGLGIALGVVLGVVMDNIGVGIAIGIALGAGFEARKNIFEDKNSDDSKN